MGALPAFGGLVDSRSGVVSGEIQLIVDIIVVSM
jgi:hypothetical protein